MEESFLKNDPLKTDSPPVKSQFVLIQTSKTAEGLELTGQCEAFDCAKLNALASLIGADDPSWMITSGTLEGELKVVIPKNHRPHLEGDLVVTHLNFHHLKGKGKGGVEEARIRLALKFYCFR